MRNLNFKKYLLVLTIMTFAMGVFAQVFDIDKNVYQTAVINKKVWMTENLNVTRFRNGDTIPEVKTFEEWINAGAQRKPAWCYFNNDAANGKKYGKLYNWVAVNDPRGLAPEGWHIPLIEEWVSLLNFLGIKYGEMGKHLKANSGWNDDGNGTNKSGFTGIPGGFRNYSGVFNGIGYYGYWWTASEQTAYQGWYYQLKFDSEDSFREGSPWISGMSVRCVKD